MRGTTRIKPFDNRPTAERLADHLRRELTRPGNMNGLLPGERTLAAQMDVGRATLKQALNQLRSECVVRSVPGSGWQVRPWPEWERRP
jgi:GntR family L-lactate dehydrogenase operon transcriptional regulator